MFPTHLSALVHHVDALHCCVKVTGQRPADEGGPTTEDVAFLDHYRFVLTGSGSGLGDVLITHQLEPTTGADQALFTFTPSPVNAVRVTVGDPDVTSLLFLPWQLDTGAATQRNALRVDPGAPLTRTAVPIGTAPLTPRIDWPSSIEVDSDRGSVVDADGRLWLSVRLGFGTFGIDSPTGAAVPLDLAGLTASPPVLDPVAGGTVEIPGSTMTNRTIALRPAAGPDAAELLVDVFTSTGRGVARIRLISPVVVQTALIGQSPYTVVASPATIQPTATVGGALTGNFAPRSGTFSPFTLFGLTG